MSLSEAWFMLHARQSQSVAVDGTSAFEEDDRHQTSIVTQAALRDASAAVNVLLVQRKYTGGSFSEDSTPAKAASDDDYTGHPQTADGRPPCATFHARQEWEGYVLNIGKEAFEARLIDLTAGAMHEDEEATVPLQEISDHDAKKLRVGAIFRWVIGYERTEGGSRRRVSQIVFRDLPAVTKSDLRDGEVWARDMFQSLNP
jgi:hypothetical protein